MDYESFIGAVQNRARLGTREDAVRLTRITLETLSERLDPGEADDLAAQLPEEVGHHLRRVDGLDSFDREGFVDRVVEKGGYADDGRADAVFHTQVVMDVVEEAVSAGELADVRAGLPAEYDELFELAEQDERPVDEEQRPG